MVSHASKYSTHFLVGQLTICCFLSQFLVVSNRPFSSHFRLNLSAVFLRLFLWKLSCRIYLYPYSRDMGSQASFLILCRYPLFLRTFFFQFLKTSLIQSLPDLLLTWQTANFSCLFLPQCKIPFGSSFASLENFALSIHALLVFSPSVYVPCNQARNKTACKNSDCLPYTHVIPSLRRFCLRKTPGNAIIILWGKL